MTRTWCLLLLAAALSAPATGATAAECMQEINALKGKIQEHAKAPPQPPGTETRQGKQQTDQGWYEGGVKRAEELLFNASQLAESGKVASCQQLVAEARRAVGLIH